MVAGFGRNFAAEPARIMSPEEQRVREAIGQTDPLQVFHRLIAENDQLIRGSELDNGRELAAARTAIYTELVRHWAAAQQRAFGYDRPFAVVALGGTGRGEMTPWSDNDFALLFDGALEGNRFLIELQQQILNSDRFEREYGFACAALPFSLDDVPSLNGKQLNSFLDMRPVYDPDDLASLFRERIRATFDPFEHFLHVRGFWRGHWEKAAGEYERIERFDIKNDGLRVFLAGIWTLAGPRFQHSHEVYRESVEPRDLAAYYYLLRTRSFVHARRRGGPASTAAGNHAEDVLTFEDFNSFGEMLGPGADERERYEFAGHARARLLSARRRVASFAKGVIERELREGHPVAAGSLIVYGSSGLRYAVQPPARNDAEKSRAALSLLLASQRYGVPVDPSELQTTFRNAGDWLVRVPELSALFYEQQGSLADSFAFLAQFDGAEERLFPGHARFESGLDGRVMARRQALPGASEREKLRALESYVRDGRAKLAEPAPTSPGRLTSPAVAVPVEIEAALLDADHLAAVKLALKTKRLPLTPDDLVVRADEQRPLYERLSTGLSEIPLADYYQPYCTECDFPREVIRIAEFLVANRRAFKERAEAGPNDEGSVRKFAGLCQDEQLLRALFVFTCADRAAWEGPADEPTRWFNSRELYTKAMRVFKPTADPALIIEHAGFSPEELKILRDFGADFFGGVYRHYASRFGEHLARLALDENVGPKVAILREGMSVIVGVAARDYRGLAAVISGALWHHDCDIRQAHLFSAMNHNLALDFFHLGPREGALPPGLTKSIEDAIRKKRHIAEADEASLPSVAEGTSLREWNPGQYCLRFETQRDRSGLVYALSYKVFRHLRGDIFGLTAGTGRGAYISVYLNLPEGLSLGEAQQIVAERF